MTHSSEHEPEYEPEYEPEPEGILCFYFGGAGGETSVIDDLVGMALCF